MTLYNPGLGSWVTCTVCGKKVLEHFAKKAHALTHPVELLAAQREQAQATLEQRRRHVAEIEEVLAFLADPVATQWPTAAKILGAFLINRRRRVWEPSASDPAGSYRSATDAEMLARAQSEVAEAERAVEALIPIHRDEEEVP